MTPREQLLAALSELEEKLDFAGGLANEALEALEDADSDLGREINEAGNGPHVSFLTSVRLLVVLRAFAEKSSVQEIHKAFGAPGDWGYHTPLGSALFRLYSEKEGKP